jgi:UDP-N-acetylmuramate--alanine ligase
MNFDDIKNVHFVGIGGIGMSGIAEILKATGVTVSGCDLKRSASTDLLTRNGIAVSIGHDPEHVKGMDLVVMTAAVKGQNAEIDEARRQGIAVLKRSAMLGEIVSRKRAVGVAGTHGKTTTTAMISMVLREAGLDPTVMVGGMVSNFGGNSVSGKGEFFVVEADEYDRTFHHLHPEVAVITNIEADHLEYYGSFEAIIEAFEVFIGGIKEGGVVIGCSDDPVVSDLLAKVTTHRVVRYGLGDGADVKASRLRFDERGVMFDLKGVSTFKLFVPGEHNIQNALAAIAVGQELGIDEPTIARGLAKFLGVDRRFQILGQVDGAIVVDDYAHHPTEIRATLNAARMGYPGRRIVALFQPHLYSRTRDFASEFAQSMLVADLPMVAPIYAAREEPIGGITGRLIADAAEGIEFIDKPNHLITADIRARLQPNDIFITMGAGDVHQIAEALVAGGRA